MRFNPIPFDLLTIYLSSISSKEELDVPPEILEKIARNSRGDVRQAINALQTVSGKNIVGALTDHQFMSDSSALDAVLKADSLAQCLVFLRQYDAQPYDKIRAIYDSVVAAKNLSLESKSQALKLVAEADMVLGRIQREQSWRLLRYFDRFLASAIATKKIVRTDSSIPWNLKLAIWNDGRVLKQMSIALTEEYHAGKSSIAAFYLPFLAFYFKNRPEAMDEFIDQNSFGDSEKRVLAKLTVKK